MSNSRTQKILNMVNLEKEKECLENVTPTDNVTLTDTATTSNSAITQSFPVRLRDVANLMKNSSNLELPSFLLPIETSSTKEDLPVISSIDVLKKFSNSTLLINENEPKQVFLNSFQSLVDDLNICSPDTDPYAGDDEDKDPDYVVPEQSAGNDQKSSLSNNNSQILDSDSDVAVAEDIQKNKSRKRLRNSLDWKRNIKPTCLQCRMQCLQKIYEEERIHIHKEYWELGELNRQRDYIAKYVEIIHKSRNRKRKVTKEEEEEREEDESSRRNFTLLYYLPTATKRVRICKTFFLNTLGISAQTVRTVFNKMGSTGIVSEDKREKVSKHNVLDESVKQSIRHHINAFETMESHYCRQKTTRLYLPPTLNISKMYSLYEEYCQHNDISRKGTEIMYKTIFNTEFNMSFFQPKKDLCDICHKYEHCSIDEKMQIEEEFQQHIKNKNKARELKNNDKEKAKEDPSLCAAVFDLLQMLSVPKSEVGLAYYKLKLSTYNFSIFDLTTKDSYCYMWYENIGKRGSSEIGSCLLNFIENHVKKGTKKFSFYSDNCSGKNRNKYLFSLHNHISQKHRIKIRHTFLERDSVIEKAARNIPSFIIIQIRSILCGIIKTACILTSNIEFVKTAQLCYVHLFLKKVDLTVFS